MWHPVTQGTGRNEQHKQAAVFHGVNSITLFDQKNQILGGVCCPNSALQAIYSGCVYMYMMTSSKWKFENQPQ